VISDVAVTVMYDVAAETLWLIVTGAQIDAMYVGPLEEDVGLTVEAEDLLVVDATGVAVARKQLHALVSGAPTVVPTHAGTRRSFCVTYCV
jgi:hypothetical protein